MSERPTITLRLHPKQETALDSTATEVLFGGAAGGGKSHLMRCAAIIWCASVPGLQVYLFRRLFPDLIKNHLEGPKGFRSLLAPWVAEGFAEIVEEEIRFWNGSKIFLCHCKDEKDRFKYQGAEIHVLLIDELTHFSEVIYRFLRTRVRAVGLNAPPNLRIPRILCGSNPGNVGHQWVKQSFVDGGPFTVRRMPDEEGGMLRQYIPSRLDDNPSMTTDDPTYRARLKGAGSASLVKALEDGDWNVIEGAFFDVWRTEKHVVPPFDIPDHWLRFRSFDWGYGAPFSVGWWTVASEPIVIGDRCATSESITSRGSAIIQTGQRNGSGRVSETGLTSIISTEIMETTIREILSSSNTSITSDASTLAQEIASRLYENRASQSSRERDLKHGLVSENEKNDLSGSIRSPLSTRLIIPRGCLIRYREWYGATSANVGMRLEAEQIAQGIIAREEDDKITTAVADTQIFAQEGQAYGYRGPTIGERLNRTLAAAKHQPFLAADKSRRQGWDQMRGRLRGDLDGNPMLVVFDTCTDFVRTVPTLQHDPLKPEDLDTDSEDHIADECFIAGTLIDTKHGKLPIEVLRVGDRVKTRSGLRAVDAVFSVGERDVYRLSLSNGEELIGTANHPIFVSGFGWKSLASMRYGDMLRTCEKQSSSRAEPITDIQTTRTGTGGSTSGTIIARCIETFTRAFTGRSATPNYSSTTRTRTRSTTTRAIWISWLMDCIRSIIGPRESLRSSFASTAAGSSYPAHGIMSGSVAIPANPHTAGRPAWTTRNAYALHADLHSDVTVTRSSGIALTNAPVVVNTNGRCSNLNVWNVERVSLADSVQCTAPPHVVSVTPAGRQKVFNLSVADAEEYYANGVLVHNCRYACMARPWAAPTPKPPGPVVDVAVPTLADLVKATQRRKANRVERI